MTISFEDHEAEVRRKMRDARNGGIETCMERLRYWAARWGAEKADIESAAHCTELIELASQNVYDAGYKHAKDEPLSELVRRILERELLCKLSEVVGDYEDRAAGIWAEAEHKGKTDWPNIKCRQIADIRELSGILKAWGVFEQGQWKTVPLYEWRKRFEAKGESP